MLFPAAYCAAFGRFLFRLLFCFRQIIVLHSADYCSAFGSLLFCLRQINVLTSAEYYAAFGKLLFCFRQLLYADDSGFERNWNNSKRTEELLKKEFKQSYFSRHDHYNGLVSVRTTFACTWARAHHSKRWCATSAEALPIVVPSAPPSLVGMTQHEVI